MPVPVNLSLPDFGSSLRLQIANLRLVEVARTACPSDADSVVRAVLASPKPRALEERYAGLFDDLGAHLRSRSDDDAERLIQKALLEFEAVEHIERLGILGLLAGSDSFLDMLLQVHHAVTGRKSVFRTRDVIIRPDASGNVTIFPPWQQCEPLLRALASFISLNFVRAPGLCATIAFAGIIHAHPFRDGNGRTARVLFNLLMRQATGAAHFAPLSKFSMLSSGGFVIKLRRVLYGGEWEPLAIFYADALKLSHELQKESRSQFSRSLEEHGNENANVL